MNTIGEVLRDALRTWTTTSESVIDTTEPTPRPLVPARPSTPVSTDLKPLVDLAMKLSDQSGPSSLTTQRVDRLLALTLALNSLLVAAVATATGRHGSNADVWGQIALTMTISIAGKGWFHALRALAPRTQVSITPDLVDAGMRCAAGHDIRQDYIDILHAISITHARNDRARAIAVEHSVLAWRTTIVQVAVCIAFLLLLTWLPASDRSEPIGNSETISQRPPPAAGQSALSSSASEISASNGYCVPDGGARPSD